MKPSTLGILMLCPFAVFVADKSFGLSGGGTKNAKGEIPTYQQEARLQYPNQANVAPELSNATQVEVVHYNEYDGGRPKLSHSEMVAELRGQIEVFESAEFQEGYWDLERTHPSYNGMLKNSEDFFEKEIQEKMEKANVMGIDLDRMFGRCPTGYSYTIVASGEEMPTNRGFLIANQGCHHEVFGQFVYDLKQDKVEVLVSEKAGYVSVAEYLKLYKEAMDA